MLNQRIMDSPSPPAESDEAWVLRLQHFDDDSSTGLKNKTGNGLKSKNGTKRPELTSLGSIIDDIEGSKRLKLEHDNPDMKKEVELLAKRLEEDGNNLLAKNAKDHIAVRIT